MKSRHRRVGGPCIQRRIRSYVLTNCRSLGCCLPHITFSNKRDLFEFACNAKLSRFNVGMMSGIGKKIK